jgi:hypothetical protein
MSKFVVILFMNESTISFSHYRGEYYHHFHFHLNLKYHNIKFKKLYIYIYILLLHVWHKVVVDTLYYITII